MMPRVMRARQRELASLSGALQAADHDLQPQQQQLMRLDFSLSGPAERWLVRGWDVFVRHPLMQPCSSSNSMLVDMGS